MVEGRAKYDVSDVPTPEDRITDARLADSLWTIDSRRIVRARCNLKCDDNVTSDEDSSGMEVILLRVLTTRLPRCGKSVDRSNRELRLTVDRLDRETCAL